MHAPRAQAETSMATSALNWPLILLVSLWLVTQYGLAVWALRDLQRRPRVRGEKKVLWALLILIVPIVGPIIYSSLGPTSFLPRQQGEQQAPPRSRHPPTRQ